MTGPNLLFTIPVISLFELTFYHNYVIIKYLIAAESGHKEIVEVLLKKGANVNAVDELGKTPLDYAKSRDVVKALLKAAFVKAFRKGMIAGGATTLLGTAIAVALFATGTIAAELIPIVIAVVAITAAALVVDGATYMLLKPSAKVDGVKKPPAVLTPEQ